MEADGDVEVVHLDEDDQGVILESWDDQCFPVFTTSVEAEPGETSEEEKLVNAS
ncbi:hypothetical protein HID58_028479, partial [Brassica napus]